jgi:hypothetical protein
VLLLFLDSTTYLQKLDFTLFTVLTLIVIEKVVGRKKNLYLVHTQYPKNGEKATLDFLTPTIQKNESVNLALYFQVFFSKT